MDLGGVGVGYRAELSAELLRAPQRVDFVELLCESSLASKAAEREAEAVSRVWPTLVHGVKLSLGSAEGIDVERARRLGAFARKVGAQAISEHASFVRAGGIEIGHLTATPFTREAARVIAKNADRVRRHLPDVPFLIENVAWSMRYADDALTEGQFHREVLERSGCGLLLDLGNVLANATNAGVSPRELLESYPLERTAQIHIAGGCLEGGFYFDTHGHAVGDEVFELLELVMRKVGPVPIVLERDEHIPRLEALSREVDRARAIFAHARPPKPLLPSTPVLAEESANLETALAFARFQEVIADTLTSDAPMYAGLHPEDVLRSRGILQKKRIEDAMALLPRLTVHAERLRSLAAEHVGRSARARHGAAVVDALAIADLAQLDGALSRAARLDRLVLTAHFVETEIGFEPRRGPFLAREATGDARAWVWKSLGRRARVNVLSEAFVNRSQTASR